MVSVIKDFSYKTPGRGRGILGLRDFKPCRRPGAANRPEGKTERPGETGVEAVPASEKLSAKLVVALFDYSADTTSPGGFTELSLQKGYWQHGSNQGAQKPVLVEYPDMDINSQLLELVAEHPDNEHWWEVRNEDGKTGFVPASYVLIKEEQALPWLQLSALHSEEEERKQRAKRLTIQKDAEEGRGFGLPPKQTASNLAPRPYVSAYNRTTQQAKKTDYYCEVCDKHLNGPKPYQAHLGSKAHKEELALRDS